MLMINVGVDTSNADNGLQSLEKALERISNRNNDLEIGENLAEAAKVARERLNEINKSISETNSEFQKAFALAGLKYVMKDIDKINEKIRETGANIEQIKIKGISFEGRDIINVKDIDGTIKEISQKLESEIDNSLSQILRTKLGGEFFKAQSVELKKQLEGDLKSLAEDFSQEKLEQYVNKFIKKKSIDAAQKGRQTISTSGSLPTELSALLKDNKISNNLAANKIDIKKMFQEKAKNSDLIKQFNDQTFHEFVNFLNSKTDLNTFGQKYSDSDIEKETQRRVSENEKRKESIRSLKEELNSLIETYNKTAVVKMGGSTEEQNEVFTMIASIARLRNELEQLKAYDIPQVKDVGQFTDWFKELNSELRAANDGLENICETDISEIIDEVETLSKYNVDEVISSGASQDQKLQKLQDDLNNVNELISRVSNYEFVTKEKLPNFVDEIFGENVIEDLNNKRAQIITALNDMAPDILNNVQGNIERLNAELEKLKSSNDPSENDKQNIEKLEKEVERLSVQKAKLEKETRSWQTQSGENNSGNRNVSDTNDTNAESNNVLVQDAKEAEALQEKLKAVNEELEKLRELSKNSESDSSEISKLKEEVSSLTEQKRVLEEQLKKFTSQPNEQNGANSEIIKQLMASVEKLQLRMTKAEEILNDVPAGMNGLKRLSSQIEKMSGNFNEDGSIKNLGVTAETLSERFKQLDEEFDAKLEKKISELEKKIYKENQPNRKLKLAGSLKELKIIAANTPTANEVKANAENQDNAVGKTEEINKELYKETEAYKSLSEEVKKFNDLTSQKIGETDFDARIKRLQDMQACVERIIKVVEDYDGKASELSNLTLFSKNGNVPIQDTTKLDRLMDELKSGENKNIKKKNLFTQDKEIAAKYEAIIKEYDQKFQSIISQDVTSNKQFNKMKQDLQDLSNSLNAITEKYNSFKKQDFYSPDIANYGEAVRGKVADAFLDLNDEIEKYKGSEKDILAIQAKYSETAKRIKQEQDATAEAIRKKAEAEKQAAKVLESEDVSKTNIMSVAEKSREEQKHKALERQTVQNVSGPNVGGFTESSQQEIQSITAIDKTIKDLTQHIKDKNKAIADEATAMSEAAQSEINDVSKISNAVTELSNKISAIPKIDTKDTATTNLDANLLNENQTTAIREQLAAALGENNPVPISFIPDIDSLRKQIADELGKVPIEITNNDIKETLNIKKVKIDSKALIDNIKNVKIESFKLTNEAITNLKDALGKAMTNVGLSLDTKQLQADIEAAIANARKKEAEKEANARQRKPLQKESTSSQKQSYEKIKDNVEKAFAAAEKFKEQYSGLLSEELNNEVDKVIDNMSVWKSVSIDISNSDDILTWNDESKKLLDTWEKIQEKIKSSVVASGKAGEIYTATMDYSQYTKKTNKTLTGLNTKYADNFTDKQSAEFEKRLESIREKIKEINDDTSKYTSNNVNAIETDIEQLEKFAKDIATINKSEDKINSLIQELSNSKNSIKLRGSEGQNYARNIENKINELKNLSGQAKNVNFEDPTAVQEFINRLNEAVGKVNELKEKANEIKVKDNAVSSIEKLNGKFDDLIFKIQEFRKENTNIDRDSRLASQFDELLQSAQTVEHSTKAFNELNAKFNALKATVMSKGMTGRSLGDELSYIASKIGLKAIIGGSVYKILDYFKQMVVVVRELDTGMTNLKRVSEETEATYRGFMDSAAEKARNLGSTMQQVIDATTDFSRLGYSLQEASELANNALMYSNVGEIDINQASSDMISALKAFNIASTDSIHVVDVFNKLGNEFAVTAANIGEGLSQSASALAVAGNDFEESAAMITAITEITQDASSAGNALKTLSLRLRSTSTDLSQAGEDSEGACTSIAKLQDKMKALAGVDILNSEGTFRSTYDIIKDIAHNWDNIDEMNKSGIIETLGGKTRANQVSALISNFAQAEKALNAAINSENSALNENATYVDSIEGRIAQLKASYQKLSNDVVSSGVVKFFVSTGDAILRATDAILTFSQILEGIAPDSSWAKYFDNFKAVPSIIAAISAGISIKNKGEKADGILGIYMPFVRATEQMHKSENCWKSLTPFYQSAA